MPREAHQHSCVGTGFIVLDVIRNSVGPTATEKRFAGGSCGNVLTILSYFGWNSNAIGRIGDDHVGHELVDDLSKWHVNTKFLQMEAGRGTPIVVQENYLDARGRPRHRFSRACPVCGATLPAYRPLLTSDAATIAAKLSTHSVFYFDRVAPGTLELAQKSRERGALVVFEPSGIKDERLFAECLKASHIVKYANDRIEGVNEIVARAKVPVEIETLGAKGLRLRVRTNGRTGAWKELAAFLAPELRDAAGAGDWTTAGIIHGLMGRRASADQAVADADAVVLATQQGQALAALNCGFEGARGLMYVADSKRILELAAAIAKGTKVPSVAEVQSKRRVNELRADKACLTCSGARALHL
jgi:fructokinase